jgi:hypothetical protein
MRIRLVTSRDHQRADVLRHLPHPLVALVRVIALRGLPVRLGLQAGSSVVVVDGVAPNKPPGIARASASQSCPSRSGGPAALVI